MPSVLHKSKLLWPRGRGRAWRRCWWFFDLLLSRGNSRAQVGSPTVGRISRGRQSSMAHIRTACRLQSKYGPLVRPRLSGGAATGLSVSWAWLMTSWGILQLYDLASVDLIYRRLKNQPFPVQRPPVRQEGSSVTSSGYGCFHMFSMHSRNLTTMCFACWYLDPRGVKPQVQVCLMPKNPLLFRN